MPLFVNSHRLLSPSHAVAAFVTRAVIAVVSLEMLGEPIQGPIVYLHHVREGITEDVSHLEHQVDVHKIGPYEVLQIGRIIGVLSG